MALATSNSTPTPFEVYLELAPKWGGRRSYRYKWADGCWKITKTADHQPISDKLKKQLNIQWWYWNVLNENRQL